MKKMFVCIFLSLLILLQNYCFADVVVGPTSYTVFSSMYLKIGIVALIFSTVFLVIMLYLSIFMLKKMLDVENCPNNAQKYKKISKGLSILFVLLYTIGIYMFIRNVVYYGSYMM